MKLFAKEKIIGIFRGFSEGGLEFHADLILPYRNEFQSSPMHGQFLLVQLETENEAVLGRITSLSSEGRLTSGSGEDFGLRAVAEDRVIPEDLREQYLKYRVNIRVLGVVRVINEQIVFAASHRRLPHVGSKVAFLGDEVLRDVAGATLQGADIGFLAFGEFIYSGDDPRLEVLPWMQIKKPAVVPRFAIKSLVSRRSFVFARAGFGKSNLNKLLFSNLYQNTPTVEKRKGKQVPVGTVIFDPDGEYFWPDDKNRPGLCDVPHLEDKIVVFTSKTGPSSFYQSFVAGNIKLDIRRLRPSDVISIALPMERQEQQNIGKLKALNQQDWSELVDLVHQNHNSTDPADIKRLLRLDDRQEVEAYAARSNMSTIVRMLHDPSSQMMDMLLYALKKGKICVIDVSQMRGSQALTLSGLVLKRIFDNNQAEFTAAEPETIPTIAVVEEAQSVLGGQASTSDSPYIAWVKEGRKYDLGAVLITQQPGSISSEILSQGDNWFVFHLLSSGDLKALQRANAHYSDDLLSALLNEPIEGNGVFWSSVGGKSYPLPIRVLSFEKLYQTLDPDYNKPEAKTFAAELRVTFEAAAKEAVASVAKESPPSSSVAVNSAEPVSEQTPDYLEIYIAAAIQALQKDNNFLSRLKSQGIPHMGIQEAIRKELPGVINESERKDIAYQNVNKVLDIILGKEKWKYEKRPSKSKPGSTTTWIVAVS